MARLANRRIIPKLLQIREHYALPWPLRERRNLKALHALLTHAYRHVPYYRELFTRHGFSPDSVLENPGNLRRLPALTKEIIQEQGIRLCDERFRPPKYKVITRASVGPAIYTYLDVSDLDWIAAADVFSLEAAGKKIGQPEVRLSSSFRRPHGALKRALKKGKDFFLNRQELFINDFSEESLAGLWARIKEIRPALALGHASTLYELAIYARKEPTESSPISLCVSTGEKLDGPRRLAIDAAFGCRTYDRYAASELGLIAHETPSARDCGRLQLLDHAVWAEETPLEDDLHEILLTSLINAAMPLIRYRIGDLGRVERNGEGLALSRLERRIHEAVKVAGRIYPTFAFQELLAKLGGFEDYYLDIGRDNELRAISVILERGVSRKSYERRLREWLPGPTPIYFEAKGEGRRLWRNKFRHVVRTDELAGGPGAEAALTTRAGNGKARALIVSHSMAINGANNHLKEFFHLFKNSVDMEILSVSDGPMRDVFERMGASVSIFDPDSPPDYGRYSFALGNTFMTTHIISQVRRCPTALVVHESWRPEFLQQHIDAFEFGGLISEDSIKRALFGARHIIFPASFQSELYRPLLRERTSVHHIYCTIPIREMERYRAEISRREARKRLGVGEASLLFLQVGTVTARKNQAGALRSFALFRRRHPDIDARLILLGARRSRKNERAYLEAILEETERSGLKERVSIVDAVSNPYLYLRAADVMLHPSLNEVLPLAILEAGIFLLPVIASKLDGIPEVIEDGVSGCLIDPRDEEALVLRMERLAENPDLRRQMGGRLREKVAAQHSPETFIRRWIGVLKDMAGAGIGAGGVNLN